MTAAFVLGGLARGDKVLLIGERPDADRCFDVDRGLHAAFAAAVADGRLVVAEAPEVLLPRGAFEPERVLARLSAQHAAARCTGPGGLHLAIDVAPVGAVRGAERVVGFEQRIGDELVAAGCTVLCLYDLRAFSSAVNVDLARLHQVDITPGLAEIGERLAAGIERRDGTIRLAGELNVDAAGRVGDALRAHLRGARTVDVADVRYADVVGMRALRGPAGERLTITGASPATRPLLRLLGWDSDPGVDVR